MKSTMKNPILAFYLIVILAIPSAKAQETIDVPTFNEAFATGHLQPNGNY